MNSGESSGTETVREQCRDIEDYPEDTFRIRQEKTHSPASN